MQMTRALVLLLVPALLAGCVERKMTVTSDPPGALVYLDDQEKGITPVTFDFNFYGWRTFRLQQDGYQITEEIRQVAPPLQLTFPLDMVPDLTPIPASDIKSFHFVLKPLEKVDKDVLKERAAAFRERALRESTRELERQKGKPAPPPAAVEPKPEQPSTPATPPESPSQPKDPTAPPEAPAQPSGPPPADQP